MRRVNLTNQKIGQWRVLGLVNGAWECQCICGNIRRKTTGNLRDPQQQQCSACASSQRNKGRVKFKRPYEALFRRLTKVAGYRNKPCTLTYEQFLEFTKTTECEYCSLAIIWSTSSQAGATNLDRKENNQGYSKDNCVVCCSRCNRIKSSYFTYDQMLEVGALLKKWR